MKRMTALLIVYLLVVSSVSAQTATPYVFNPNSAFEFESTTANMTYTGTWATVNLNASSYRRGSNGASVSFWVRGSYLLIYRTIDPSWSGSIQVCVSTTCTWYSSNFPIGETSPIIVAIPDSINNYQITLTSNYDYAYLDYYMLLSEAALVLPTPTPITFPTGVPTWTPAPTTTPIGLVLAIDPSARYSTANGQITKFEYSSSAADTATFVILITLLFSVWGFFLVFIFVAWRYPEWRR